MENSPITEALKAQFLRLYQMAICDNQFTAEELNALYKCAEEKDIPNENLDEIFLNPINFRSTLPQTLEEKVDCLYDLAVMIWADGIISTDEYSALEKYVILFGFVEENVNAIIEYLINAVQQGKRKSEILYELKD
ncbi:hypothetical protein [Chryseobacterium sp.]|uniref:hypothetical protein n=1 Tax=Chryseobacterium sp. TaxID=1871047 RepID=UPI0025B8BF47|nr:hypothetical protein [Chryseobacterium sp.]